MKKNFLWILLAILLMSTFTSYGEENYKRHYFYYGGYSSKIPTEFQINKSREEIVTEITTQDGSKIKIYKQPIKGFRLSDYVYYSNEKIRQGVGGFSLTSSDKITYPNTATAYRTSYTRSKSDTIPNDKNMYYEIHEYYKDTKTMITFWLKTDENHIETYKEILNNMAKSTWLMDSKSRITITNPKDLEPKDTSLFLEGTDFNISIPDNQMAWGVFHPVSPYYDDFIEGVEKLEDRLDKRFEFLMTYSDFTTPMPLTGTATAYRDNRFMMLTLQPWVDGDRKSVVTMEIIRGNYDGYLRKWARNIKSLNNPILFRPSNEMNGDWSTWSAWYLGKDTDLYIEAWKRMYRIFKEEGADNAYFVWNPHDRSYPDFAWNNPHLYYPGDEYVDFVGLTGYNNGTSHKADVWREFKDIYYPLYIEYMYYYSNKPFLVTEFSCNEVGGNKANWISDGFKYFKDMPNIKLAVWFNRIDGLWKYNINSSQEAEDAFKNSIQGDYFTNNIIMPKEDIQEEIKEDQ
ncbi:glycoside hydrolase family 26 protein [Anaeromicrobium sediminis]|uniref:GH26 domain-containing protein n=1 Tax=Anaeromicrobium sediminis TaxID=1478221 RepID=A0A267MI93_9FIRM|nr:glycosyl hydrolase [Anaeromicrobium sediminis]PAB58520.1 hypothetical protein CCE28_14535 [Anaeromicrobium sediminis]